ncbi:MAG: hypothetical protein M0P34_00885, partial [Desulfocurvus sp.]|nr:hypothetical protein [Desulfocurvus sp.]
MSIRNKLLLIVLATLAGLACIFVVNMLGQARIATSVHGEAAMFEAEIATLRAQLAEEDFLARRDAANVERHAAALAAARASLAQCAE